MQKKTILITGATDGIGRALAKIYRSRGNRLVLVGRRALDTRNDALYTKDTYCQSDLSQNDCAERVCEFLNAQKIDTIDLAIQNAGTGYFGPIAEQSAESIREIVAVNLMAPLCLTHALIPYLKKTNGKLVLIGSIAHAFPCPDYAVYAATKEALNALGRNLQIEGDINVQIIQPGRHAHGLASQNWHGQRNGISVRRKSRPKNHPSDRRTTFGHNNRMAKRMGAIFGTLLRRHGKRHDATEDEVKHAVITGAAAGIGNALAHRFAQAGYAITGVDVDTAGAARVERELNARFVIADLRSEPSIARVLSKLQGKPIDVLIHNAGINAVGRFPDISIEDHEQLIAVKLLRTNATHSGITQSRFDRKRRVHHLHLLPVPLHELPRVLQLMRQPKADWPPTHAVYPSPSRRKIFTSQQSSQAQRAQPMRGVTAQTTHAKKNACHPKNWRTTSFAA